MNSGSGWSPAAGLMAAVVAAGMLAGGCSGPQKMYYIQPDAAQDRLGGPDMLANGAAPAKLDQVEVRLEMETPEPIPEIRREGLVAAAQGYGAQLGFDRKAWEIEESLERHSSGLSTVFDFRRVVSAGPRRVGYVVPPVVQRSFHAFQGDGNTASAADEYLVVRQPGRIRPVTPTWRDWLLMHRPEPKKPARSLLPSTAEEWALFRRELRAGWKAGERQAVEELEERFTRLLRDYEGMLEYNRLVALGMMDRMVLDDADWGVTVDGTTMRIGSRTVRIESAASFQGDPTQWRPAPAWNGPPVGERRLSHRG